MSIGWPEWAWIVSAFSFLNIALALINITSLMLQRKEPPATIGWILAISFIPVVGSVIYLAFGTDRMARRAARQRKRSRRARSLLPAIVGNLDSAANVVGQIQLLKLLEKLSPYPPVQRNRVGVLRDMNANFDQQIRAIETAQHHVHLEYYIFQPDQIGERFLKAMVEAASRGVEVRFLFDAVGGFSLTSDFLKRLERGGVKVARHIPMNLLTRRWTFNFRNHRKILVVDGATAFMGGANIGEEYLGRSEIGTWLDLHLHLAGPCVVHLQRVFAEDWAFASGQPLQGDHYFRPMLAEGDIVLQVVPSGPDLEVQVMHEAFFAAITGAVEKVRLMTPYFVPTEPLRTALETTARRGVDVEIIVPGTNTKPFVRWASHSYYSELLEAGVKIYEFTPGFLHAKAMTIDGRWSLVGTPNLDNRSLRLNFEVAAAIYDNDITSQIDDLFEATRARSAQVDFVKWRARGVPRRVRENFARLFSPVL
ncbi:cardiolipin synthase [bacterium]|nr:cardiolipin synthase [bacterium]